MRRSTTPHVIQGVNHAVFLPGKRHFIGLQLVSQLQAIFVRREIVLDLYVPSIEVPAGDLEVGALVEHRYARWKCGEEGHAVMVEDAELNEIGMQVAIKTRHNRTLTARELTSSSSGFLESSLGAGADAYVREESLLTIVVRGTSKFRTGRRPHVEHQTVVHIHSNTKAKHPDQQKPERTDNILRLAERSTSTQVQPIREPMDIAQGVTPSIEQPSRYDRLTQRSASCNRNSALPVLPSQRTDIRPRQAHGSARRVIHMDRGVQDVHGGDGGETTGSGRRRLRGASQGARNASIPPKPGGFDATLATRAQIRTSFTAPTPASGSPTAILHDLHWGDGERDERWRMRCGCGSTATRSIQRTQVSSATTPELNDVLGRKLRGGGSAGVGRERDKRDKHDGLHGEREQHLRVAVRASSFHTLSRSAALGSLRPASAQLVLHAEELHREDGVL
ncbi:hypothetical protein B0H10DRAFT_1961307 [Mycena sp. CBHHK59/15]|nr:hypothetical protein B0H10DRAFT_1961307 [Mycena sp. CBHHK59/15]